MSFVLNVGAFINNGGRSYQEDRLTVLLNFDSYISKYGNSNSSPISSPKNKHAPLPISEKIMKKSFFALYDGHGGSIASTLLSNTFHNDFIMHEKFRFAPLAAIDHTWDNMDSKIFKECKKESIQSNVKRNDGSTATICYITGTDLYLTNCGDSSAYGVFEDGTTKVLTEEHGTHIESEQIRCQRAGGQLIPQYGDVPKDIPCCCCKRQDIVGKPRIQPGGLLVTRSFGDEMAKDGRKIVIPDHGKVTYLKLENEKNKLKYVIMASDGVWDALTIEEVIDCIPCQSGKSNNKVSPQQVNFVEHIVGERNDFKASLNDIAERIVLKSINAPYWVDLKSSADNTSCIVLEFGGYKPVMYL